MNNTLRYHILGKAYKKNVSSNMKKMNGRGAAHKKDYDNVDMLENVMSNINSMKLEDRKEIPKIRTANKNVSGGSTERQRKMPIHFKFKI